MKRSFIVAAVLAACAAAASAQVDWNSDPMAGARAVVAAARNAAGSAYVGFVAFDGEGPSLLRLKVSPSGKVRLTEGNISCDVALEKDGDAVKLCSGELLLGLKAGLASGKAMGDVVDGAGKSVAGYILVPAPAGSR